MDEMEGKKLSTGAPLSGKARDSDFGIAPGEERQKVAQMARGDRVPE